MSEYIPNPVDLSDVYLPEDLMDLQEKIAKNVHEVWAKERQLDGWKYGKERNTLLKTTPCMVPYENLPEEEKEYDRKTAMESLKMIYKLGYRIVQDDKS